MYVEIFAVKLIPSIYIDFHFSGIFKIKSADHLTNILIVTKQEILVAWGN